MKIVTSLSPRRLARQQLCVNSWLKVGCTVTAVQSTGESFKLQPLYPDVTFVETDLIGDVFRRPHLVRISAILNQVQDGNILILNSDIEVRSTERDFKRRWSEPDPDTIKVGIRWDENKETKELTLLKYGIDAFQITPDIASKLKDIGMTMGCPAWDYWVLIHLARDYNYKVITYKEPELIHEIHPKTWNGDDFQIGLQLLKRFYNLNIRDASSLIRRLTERV